MRPSELAQAHDTNFIAQILKVSRAGLLWIFDRGFYDFGFFALLIESGAAWITRSKSNLSYSVSQVLEQSDEDGTGLFCWESTADGLPDRTGAEVAQGAFPFSRLKGKHLL